MPNRVEFASSIFGGHLKTPSSNRKCSLTNALLKSDFFDFVVSRSGKPLFYDITPDRKAKNDEHTKLSHRTGAWLRKFPKSNPKISTHHGFRHWIYTRAGDVGVSREIVNDFVGHSRPGAQGRYGQRTRLSKLSADMAKVFDLFEED